MTDVRVVHDRVAHRVLPEVIEGSPGKRVERHDVIKVRHVTSEPLLVHASGGKSVARVGQVANGYLITTTE